MTRPGVGTGTPSDHRVQAMLTEYDLLRQESLAAIGHRLSILSFSFAALAVLTAGLLQRKVDDALAGVVALAFVPQFAKASLLVWLGEHARSQRAGRYLVGLERRVNAEVGGQALSWETSLAAPAPAGGSPDSRRLHMKYPYVAVVVLLLGVGWAAEGLGLYLLAEGLTEHWPDRWAVVVTCLVGAAAVAAEVWFLRFFAGHWRAATRADDPDPTTP